MQMENTYRQIILQQLNEFSLTTMTTYYYTHDSIDNLVYYLCIFYNCDKINNCAYHVVVIYTLVLHYSLHLQSIMKVHDQFLCTRQYTVKLTILARQV